MWKKSGDTNSFMHSVKMVEHNLRILQCSHLKTFKEFTDFHHYAWKGYSSLCAMSEAPKRKLPSFQPFTYMNGITELFLRSFSDFFFYWKLLFSRTYFLNDYHHRHHWSDWHFEQTFNQSINKETISLDSWQLRLDFCLLLNFWFFSFEIFHVAARRKVFFIFSL